MPEVSETQPEAALRKHYTLAQGRLIEQRNLWYLRWKRATCAFFIVVAIVVVWGIVEVVFS
jgi:uncharacterized membrane protein SpoIIM required for sporulation